MLDQGRRYFRGWLTPSVCRIGPLPATLNIRRPNDTAGDTDRGEVAAGSRRYAGAGGKL